MTPYELSNALLENLTMEYDCDKYMEQAANMLRQQADELKKWEEINERQARSIKNKADRIAELEKEIQSLHMDEMVRLGQEIDAEPVAWLALNELNGKYSSFTEFQRVMMLPHIQQMYSNWTPLYTTPQTKDGCGNCHACLVGVMENHMPVTSQRMICCPDCGNKQCPKASNHRHKCTGSNEVGQYGSIYTTPQTKHEVNGKAVPLSDEEKHKLWGSFRNGSTYDQVIAYGNAIEERILGK